MNSQNVLVAYFSCSGTTRRMAEKERPYTAADLDWKNRMSRTSVEMRDPSSRPAIAGSLPDMRNYEIVFLGFPVWWYIAPTIINTFIEGCNLAGKKVVPFATSGGSGIANCEKNLRLVYPQIDWKAGKLLNGSLSKAEMDEWLEKINIG